MCSSDLASAIQGVAFSGYTVTATGGDIVYSVDNVLPGLAIDSSTGSITGTPTSTSGGSWTIVLGATNSAGSDSKNLVVDYTAIPILDSALTDTALEGAAFSYSITALNTPTSYAATFLPSGLYVNTGTGAVTGTPTGTSSTTWNIGIGATNAAGTDTDTLVVTYTAKPTVAASQTFSHTNSSTGLSNFVSATNTPTSWAVTSDPNGFFTDHPFMVFSTSTGEIYGDLSATTNTYHLSITATNAAGTRAPVTVTYTVT